MGRTELFKIVVLLAGILGRQDSAKGRLPPSALQASPLRGKIKGGEFLLLNFFRGLEHEILVFTGMTSPYRRAF